MKVFNTINFTKSMHYNPFAYLHSEKDILKLVTTLIANTKGESKGGDDFWLKAETLLYTALIGYIHYEAPEEEQNFSTLLEMINAMEVREDDEEFKNPVDMMFDELAEQNPDHFAVRQYAKYKLAAGKTSSKSTKKKVTKKETGKKDMKKNATIDKASESKNAGDKVVTDPEMDSLSGQMSILDFLMPNTKAS